MAEDRVYGDNVFADDLPRFEEGVRGLRMERTDDCPLVCAVWELDAGVTAGPYHLHHGTDELLIVLRGTATVRTPDGERELPAGGVLQFPRGLPGAHAVMNRGDEVLRYVMVAHHGTPEIIEYLDEGVTIVGSRTPSWDGERLFKRFPSE
jgi:uncharacterized cupin superfamily protein